MKNLKMFLSAIAVLFISIAFGQEMKVTGIITDSYEPASGVNILIKGTKISTQSDFDGKYSIKVKYGDILVFNYFGSTNLIERKVDDSNVINVRLKQSELIICDFGISQYQNNEDLKTNYTPKFYPINKDETSTFDLENNFKNDIKNKILKIYLLDNKLQEISESEFNFQNKYQIRFTTFENKNQEYFEAYNKKAFDYLEDNFNDKWQNEINDEVLSFEEWQNN